MADYRDLERLIDHVLAAHPEYDTFMAYVYLATRFYDQLPMKDRQRMRREMYELAVRTGNPIVHK